MFGSPVVTVALCLALLAVRYLVSSRSPRRPSRGRWLKTARILGSAVLALATVGYTLQRQAAELGGNGSYEPSVLERIVRAVTGSARD